ncbi:MAG: hypothetical protein QE487_04000 [Fluviicola sp.]|nr:hypothetical protein [Fluviicola sp.]
MVNNADLFDPKTKEALVINGNYWTDRLSNESFTLTQLKFVSSNILTLWKESVGIATEMFWVELKKNNIDFERKDELNFALQKGRFRRVDIGMGARKDWNVMKEFDAITNRFTKDEIEKISDIIESDEKTRLELLKRCLRKKEIPQTQYLKFGESMAYMSHCGLLNKHFSEIEVDELYDIWNNFKIR